MRVIKTPWFEVSKNIFNDIVLLDESLRTDIKNSGLKYIEGLLLFAENDIPLTFLKGQDKPTGYNYDGSQIAHQITIDNPDEHRHHHTPPFHGVRPLDLILLNGEVIEANTHRGPVCIHYSKVEDDIFIANQISDIHKLTNEDLIAYNSFMDDTYRDIIDGKL